MQPLTEDQVRAALVNATADELERVAVPMSFMLADWDHLDFLAWPDPQTRGRGYIVVEREGAATGIVVRARSGRTAPGALSGGTFSITNFGVFGIDAGTPILNPGEAGILGLGSVRRRPWEHDGQIVLRDIVTLSLSFDHRLADGQEASRFLRAVGDILREPGRAMLLS